MHVEGDRGGGREGRGEERKEEEKNKGSNQAQTCLEKRVGDTSDIAGNPPENPPGRECALEAKRRT